MPNLCHYQDNDRSGKKTFCPVNRAAGSHAALSTLMQEKRLEAHASRDHTRVGPLWDGYHESRRFSRDTQSHIPPSILVYEDSRAAGSLCTSSIQSLRRAARYRGTSLIKNCPTLGPYNRPAPGTLWWSWGGGGGFL